MFYEVHNMYLCVILKHRRMFQDAETYDFIIKVFSIKIIG